MRLFFYCKKFLRYPIGFKMLLCKAAWISLIAECNLKFKRFEQFKPHQQNFPETTELSQFQKQQIRWMTKAMRILEKRAPWKPMCFNRTTTAKRLLREKGIETTLHLGFKKGKTENSFNGHAWLTFKGFFITGKIPQLNSFHELKPIIIQKD